MIYTDVLFQLPKDQQAIDSRLSRRMEFNSRNHLRHVLDFFDDVANRGDAAVREATAKYDQVELQSLRLSKEYVCQCVSSVPVDLKEAIETAIGNIVQVNQLLMPEEHWEKEIRPGTLVGEKSVPLDSVGLWIPCRKGPLISTALMLVTAAKVAGVKRIAVAMPPGEDGMADPNMVAAARLAGAQEFYVGNGVAMIAAFAQGTETIPEVDGIFGPGPGAIAAAMGIAYSLGKRTVVGIGPTDCMVIANEPADPRIVAMDLLNEAEHGPDSTALLATISLRLAENVAEELATQAAQLPEKRRAYIEANFGANGTSSLVVVPDWKSACKLANDFAPEHLMIACGENLQEEILSQITNAGEILLGYHTPFSAANYAIGITAVLPTNGFAKRYSGITCRDMLKHCTIGKLDNQALRSLLPAMEIFGEFEDLPIHALAGRARLDL